MNKYLLFPILFLLLACSAPKIKADPALSNNQIIDLETGKVTGPQGVLIQGNSMLVEIKNWVKQKKIGTNN
jgi:hypothetical protein